jgi:hypothetical protein
LVGDLSEKQGAGIYADSPNDEVLHSTFTHLRGDLDAEYGKLLISLHLD